MLKTKCFSLQINLLIFCSDMHVLWRTNINTLNCQLSTVYFQNFLNFYIKYMRERKQIFSML